MTRLAQAPLIEAIVEIRWGLAKKDSNGIHLNFTEDEANFFPGQFRATASNYGFTVTEKVNQPPFPHLINFRFRKAQDTWPCLQLGTGIFTVNQLNEGYDWQTFKPSVLEGIKILDKSHPSKIRGLSPLYVELRYRDGFILEENESSSQFLQSKLNFGFSPPDNFLKSPYLEDKPVAGHSISFQVRAKKPEGVIIFSLNEAMINGKKGFVMDTVVRTEPIKLSFKFVDKWLEEAHTAQKHAFNTLIKPDFLKAFE